MAFKQFVLDEHTQITVYKRKKSRSLRLSISPDGNIRVSIPTWTPYSAGVRFAQSKKTWIDSQMKPARLLESGQPIGKLHRLQLTAATVKNITSRVYATDIVVTHPASLHASSSEVQKVAESACLRALKKQAETLLPQRLSSLADRHGFEYGTVRIKQLKSRWGSCDQNGNITLNLYLMQVPWEYIDYVLLHELMHTKIMQHGPVFWSAMDKLMPNLHHLRQTMRRHQPVLHSPLTVAVA